MSNQLEVLPPVPKLTGEFSDPTPGALDRCRFGFNWLKPTDLPLVGEVLSAASNRLKAVRDLGHEAVSGRFSSSFKREAHDTRVLNAAVDGLAFPEAYQLYNEQYLNNGRPTYVYSNSLLVSGRHGVQMPTLYDIAAYAEQQKCAVIHHITDGYGEHLGPKQLASLTDFDQMTRRRFMVYRQLLLPDSEIIVAGESLGGMFAYSVAGLQQSEAESSNYPIRVKKLIAIASAGHNPYDMRQALTHLAQWGDELHYLVQYVLGEDTTSLSKAQRLFELAGTLPTNNQQLLASVLIAKGILGSPLVGVEARVPAETFVVDQVYGEDKVTHPNLRRQNWQAATGHPESQHILYNIPGLGHLALLSVGRATTKAHLSPDSNQPLFDLSLAA